MGYCVSLALSLGVSKPSKNVTKALAVRTLLRVTLAPDKGDGGDLVTVGGPGPQPRALTGSEGGTRVPQDLDIPRHHGSCVQKEVSLSFILGGARGAPRPEEGRGAGVGGRRGSGPLRTSSWQRSTKLPPPRRRASACGGLGLPRRLDREVLLKAEWRLRG